MHVSRVSRAVTQADVGVRMGATHRKPSFERDAYVQAVVAAGVAGVKVEQLAHATSKLLLVLELWQVGQDEGADFVAIGEPGRKLLAHVQSNKVAQVSLPPPRRQHGRHRVRTWATAPMRPARVSKVFRRCCALSLSKKQSAAATASAASRFSSSGGGGGALVNADLSRSSRA